MATKKADVDDVAVDSPESDTATDNEPAASAALFSMDDLRARLDAPLFHRDQGLSPPAQLPRLRELTFDQVAEVAPPAPVVEPPVVEPPVVEPPVVEPPVVVIPVEVPPTPPSARPKLASFSDMMSLSALQPETAPAPQPLPQSLPQRQPESVVAEAPVLGPIETEALLAVLTTFESSANKLHELNSRSSSVAAVAVPEVVVIPEPIVPPELVVIPEPVAPPEPVVIPEPVAPPEPVVPPVPVVDVEPMAAPEALVAVEVPSELPPTATQQVPIGSVADLHIAPAQGQRSSIEAELNRLAFLPDLEEPSGPVVVPTIAHTEHRDHSSVPVLSQHEMYNPRASAVMPASKRVVFESGFEGVSRRRAKKGIVRRVFSMLTVLAVLGGGLYAAKYYLLDAKWASDVRPLVDDVEQARGLDFDHAIEVTTLTADEYSLRIASYALGVSSENQEAVAGELRALGLLTGALDLRAIGLAALPETPAFYDAGSEKIYVAAGLPAETYRFAMHRALIAAMLDQEYGWGSRINDASPSVVRGTRALYEGDALATASAMLSATDRALVLEQRSGLFTTFGVLATPSQFGTAVAGRLGVSLRAFIESISQSDRATVLAKATITDGQALDLRRLVSGVADDVSLQQETLRAEVLQPGTNSQGMLFWYHALASRLDVATAWNAALAIQSDDVVVTAGATGYCVSAQLTVTPAALDGANAAFVGWAATAPAESTTTVVPSLIDGVAHIGINACDPGLAAPTNNGVPTLTLGGAPLRSEQYRSLTIAQQDLSKAQAACAVYGGDTISVADERLVVDAIEGWMVPAAHPSPDTTRADCAAA